MITTVGFQDGTVKTAKGRGIALALLTREHQEGELAYVVNKIGPVTIPPLNKGFWQGKFWPPWLL